MKPIIHCRQLVKRYGDKTVLNHINFTLHQAEIVAICGQSGCGKSTFLNVIGALDSFDSGSLTVFEQDIGKLSEIERAKLRNQKIGFVYQFHHLLKEFSALENIAMPLLVSGLSFDKSINRAKALLEKVQLVEKANAMPAELSGGQRQRIAIARAIVTNPTFVLMDEPTGNLDNDNAFAMVDILKTFNRDIGTAFVIVTHNLQIANLMPKQYLLQQGQLQAK